MYQPYGVVRSTARLDTGRIARFGDIGHSTTLISTSKKASSCHKAYGNIAVATYDGESMGSYPHMRQQSIHLVPLSAAQTCYRTQKRDDCNLHYSRSSATLGNIKHVLLPHNSASRMCPSDENLNGYLAKQGEALIGELTPRARVFLRSRYSIPYKPTTHASLFKPSCSFLIKSRRSARPFSTATSNFTSIDSSEEKKVAFRGLEFPALKIRQRLRFWEVQNPMEPSSGLESGLDQGETENIWQLPRALTKPRDNDCFCGGVEDFEGSDQDSMFHNGELLDFGDRRTFLLPGDMVELRTATSIGVELGIFVRRLGSQSQFYTMSGKWMHLKQAQINFFVPGAIEPSEVDPLIPFLPNAAAPEALEDELQSLKHALPRDIGSSLIQKMLKFWKDSDAIYREASFIFDNAHKLLAHETQRRYANLEEIADELLLETVNKHEKYAEPVLYALHRSLVQNEVGIRVSATGLLRTCGLYEISSLNEVKNINAVSDEVRKYQEALVGSARSLTFASSASFLRFIVKARYLIDGSRKVRKFTPHGMIGTLDLKAKTGDAPQDLVFGETDLQYISFIESWAGLRTFDSRSVLHGIGAAILRATERYGECELRQDIGWTFLQEVGIIAPWEDRVQYYLHHPQTEHSIQSPPSPPTEGFSFIPDTLEGLRKDWRELPVYCIDNAQAHEIDDGISIEKAVSPGEYWVHVHTADPASGISPSGHVAHVAQSAVRTVYLPGKTLAMLPSDIVRQRFSLANDRPTLAFSARMNFNGDVLEYTVTPGIVRNVKYLTPETLSSITLGTAPMEETVVTVGNGELLASMQNPRPLLQKLEMTDTDRRNLRLLHALSHGRQFQTEKRGGFTFESPSLSLTVGFSSNQPRSMTFGHHMDPTIQLRAPKADFGRVVLADHTVRNLMILAGEIAARWCHERGIPTIYRVTQRNPSLPDPKDYFQSVILPLTEPSISSSLTDEDVSKISETTPWLPRGNGRTLPLSVRSAYLRLLGSVNMSTTAAPHRALGVEMFTRSTSPLRRYSDLLLHWQLEAALLEEARSGTSLIGTVREDYLPFKKDEVEQIIKHVSIREVVLRSAEKTAERMWTIQLLLRAWKFKEVEMPTTYQLVATTIEPDKIGGDIVSLGNLHATMEVPRWIAANEINEGDVFEVELEDLNTYSRLIKVKGLSRVHIAP